jgi:hypothetical protein
MVQGTIKEIGSHGNSPFEWVPEDDPPFQVRGAPTGRRGIVAYRCASCGNVELSAP